MLRLENERSLALDLITLLPCCSFLDYGQEIWNNTSPILSLFFTDEYTLYVASVCDIKILLIQLIFNHIHVTLHHTTSLCFEHYLSMAAVKRLLLFQDQDLLTSLDISHSASNPLRLAQLPLFYPLLFARSIEGQLVMAACEDLLAVLLKDDQGRLVVSVYSVLKNVHESLLVS